ncbi:MAG: hypothetical protein AB7T59_08160 [Hyphomonadaceae bacterium]
MSNDILLWLAAAFNVAAVLAWLGKAPRHHDNLREMMGIRTNRGPTFARLLSLFRGPPAVKITALAIERISLGLVAAIAITTASLGLTSFLLAGELHAETVEVMKAVVLDTGDRLSRDSLPHYLQTDARIPDRVLSIDVLLASFSFLVGGGLIKLIGHFFASIWLTAVCALSPENCRTALRGETKDTWYYLLGRPSRIDGNT